MHRDADGRRSSTLWVGVLTAAVALAACGADGSDASGGSGADGVDGAAVFAQHCASCHGADLRGSATGPSLLSVVYEPSHHPDAAFRSAIANGSPAHHWDFGPMPIVNGISDAEVLAVIAHVREVQEREGFEPLASD